LSGHLYGSLALMATCREINLTDAVNLHSLWN
jgi:hypothetical protein